MIQMLMSDKTARNLRHPEIKCPLKGFIRKAGFQQQSRMPIRYMVGIAGAA
ncbi:hypothetical protein J2TS6_43610 [Paenibacillus albilobatus]|uniref:Uncharacterized protein n=1 Tax=Paenibacillus albilobatus TaxID=2716884 RepID=A0A920CBC4_9BACL|nr:hypothetical protein J2TS6_43610 [Paenibacillus albilobatus]